MLTDKYLPTLSKNGPFSLLLVDARDLPFHWLCWLYESCLPSCNFIGRFSRE